MIDDVIGDFYENISDIAKLAGVSKSTVSRFLNNGSVSPATKRKITKIIEENNYQPNQFAQSLRARRTNLIGAIIPRMNSYAVDETIKGLVHQCNQHRYQLLLNYTGLEIDGEISALKTLSRSKVDGIVLMATHITEAHIEVIEKIDVPVIIVGQKHDRLYSIYHMIMKLDIKLEYSLVKKVVEMYISLVLVKKILQLVFNVNWELFKR